jgi:5'(3')-deoxyribonucleotidase
MRTTIFYVDMDGVLADFVGGSLKLHGKHIPPAEVGWDFWQQVGFDDWRAFWEPLENEQFWAELEPLPDGMELFRHLERIVGHERIGILSSGLCPGSCDGKRDWLRKHLPKYEEHAIFCTKKQLCAAPCKLLIDDHDANIDAFRKAGGFAFTVPRSWNRRRGEIDANGHFDSQAMIHELEAMAGL